MNFTSPYCSTDIGEFWRRWHITLSQWFRDYLYVPLGGGRVRFWAFNVLVVFVVSGIWHGAGWNFVLWGALHALFLMAARWSDGLNLFRPLAWTLTMLAVFYSWLCFYELDTTTLLSKMGLLLKPGAYTANALEETFRYISPGNRVVLTGLVAMVMATLSIEWWSIRRLNEPYGYLRRKPALMALVILTVLLAPGENNEFIYFAF
jgi:alginate O-acetyltransferase complex protein AlgI